MKHLRRGYAGLLYLSPWLLGLVGLQLYPILASLYYSFTDFRILQRPQWAGLHNYLYMLLKDPLFFQALKVTFLYVLIAVPARIVFALLVAMALSLRLKLIGLFRTVYYLPSILGGSVVIAVLWRYLFMREGLVNRVLAVMAIRPLDWLGSPRYALMTISILPVWQFGSSMVLFLAGLKQIPRELYEAARIDGAAGAAMFLRLTLPMLSPIVLFNVIMQTINAFQEFTAAFVITEGGPLYATYLFGLKLYDEGFKYFRMGYASALSWVLFLIIFAFTMIIFRTSARWTYYEDQANL